MRFIHKVSIMLVVGFTVSVISLSTFADRPQKKGSARKKVAGRVTGLNTPQFDGLNNSGFDPSNPNIIIAVPKGDSRGYKRIPPLPANVLQPTPISATEEQRTFKMAIHPALPNSFFENNPNISRFFVDSITTKLNNSILPNQERLQYFATLDKNNLRDVIGWNGIIDSINASDENILVSVRVFQKFANHSNSSWLLEQYSMTDVGPVFMGIIGKSSGSGISSR